MEVGKPTVCRAGRQAGDPGKRRGCDSSLKAVCWQNYPLARGSQPFVLFRPSTAWMRPTYIMGGHVLYSKSSHLNVSLIPKHLHRNIQNSG